MTYDELVSALETYEDYKGYCWLFHALPYRIHSPEYRAHYEALRAKLAATDGEALISRYGIA